MNLILCGLPLAGKTYFGKRVAEKLGWKFIDTDRLIEKNYQETMGFQLTCRQIFLQQGELFFRELEARVLASLIAHKSSVIALGGGALCQVMNQIFLKKIGKIIYLEVDLSILKDRLQQQISPPAYLDAEDPWKSFELMAQKRQPIYEDCADIKLSLKGLSNQTIIKQICSFTQINQGVYRNG